MDHIFDAIEQEKNKAFLLRVSYMEIYNEKVSDLLAPRQSNKDKGPSRYDIRWLGGLVGHENRRKSDIGGWVGQRKSDIRFFWEILP